MVSIVSMILVALEIGLVAATAYLILTGVGNAPYGTLVTAGVIGAILATMIFLIRLKI